MRSVKANESVVEDTISSPTVTRFTSVLAALLLLVTPLALADDIVDEKTFSRSFAVASAPRLKVRNIWGSVRVSVGSTNEIVVSAHERRSAPTQELFLLSQSVLRLDVSESPDDVALIVGAPRNNWDEFDRCPGCRVDYQFDIAVPAGTALDVATVMDGRVDIDGVTGRISASNVNGPIAVAGSNECGILDNVNGAIEIGFNNAPMADCEIETINGDVTLTMPGNAGLDVALDLFNGRVVSGFEVASVDFPARIDRVNKDGRSRYRIEKAAGLRVGAGGPIFSIRSINGDIRIEENL